MPGGEPGRKAPHSGFADAQGNRIAPVPFHRLRRHTSVVLLSFLATVAVSLLGPMVRPVSFALLCSASGHRLVVVDANHDVQGPVGSTTRHDAGTAHCPLCSPAAPPPAFVARDFAPVTPLSHVQESIPAARLASLVGAPLPARGPPLPS